MKHLPLALLLLVSFATCSLADSPEAILKDYRKQAAQAVERLNQSLEKAATPIITKLVQQGDTAGSEELTKQMKAKIAGEPVPAPHASAVQLFTLYDEARAKALAPVQKSSIVRIDGLLKTAGGPKIEMVTELGKVREEIEAGKVVDPKALPVEWTYHRTPTSPVMATVFFEPSGAIRMEENGKITQTGTWQAGKKGVLTANFPKFSWVVTIKKEWAEIESKETPLRYLIPVKN